MKVIDCEIRYFLLWVIISKAIVLKSVSSNEVYGL